MPIGDITGVLPPQLVHEAVRLVFEVVGRLHAVTANANGVLFALAASPQLADSLAAFGASFEDDEADGSAEAGGGLTPAAFAALMAPAPRQGHPVPAWTPPADPAPKRRAPRKPSPKAERRADWRAAALTEHWPDLVRPAEDVS